MGTGRSRIPGAEGAESLVTVGFPDSLVRFYQKTVDRTVAPGLWWAGGKEVSA